MWCLFPSRERSNGVNVNYANCHTMVLVAPSVGKCRCTTTDGTKKCSYSSSHIQHKSVRISHIINVYRNCNMIIAFIIAFLLSHGRAFTVPSSPREISRSWTPTSLASISIERKQEAFGSSDASEPQHRFERTAASEAALDVPCILSIQGRSYNMTAWAKSHPGGNKILEKFNDKDATKAFFAAGHSQHAIDMLSEFLIEEDADSSPLSPETLANGMATVGALSDAKKGLLSRVRTKLFTKEDPIGIHKYCGMFVLLHFAYRFFQSIFGDPAAGMGNHMGKGSSFLSLACVIPHAVLSLSSLIFHTVPKERIVGRPMIVRNWLTL